MKMQVRSLASPSGLRIQGCCKLFHRSQMRLISSVAVAVVQVSAAALNQPLAPGTSICHRCGRKKKKKNNNCSFPSWVYLLWALLKTTTKQGSHPYGRIKVYPFLYFLFRVAPVVYGSSRARGQIGAAASHTHTYPLPVPHLPTYTVVIRLENFLGLYAFRITEGLLEIIACHYCFSHWLPLFPLLETKKIHSPFFVK